MTVIPMSLYEAISLVLMAMLLHETRKANRKAEENDKKKKKQTQGRTGFISSKAAANAIRRPGRARRGACGCRGRGERPLFLPF